MNSALMALSAGAAWRARRAMRELGVGAALCVVVALLMLGALVCGAGVIWLALRPELGAIGAWAVLGAILVGLAVLLAVGYAIWRQRSRRAASRVAANLPDLRSVLRGNEWPLIAAGLVVGFLSGLRQRR